MVLFISPPFGNYLRFPHTISILGSFTLEERPGKWSQIMKTLRYSFSYNGWINKIGLRNPGIQYAIQDDNQSSIISIAILQPDEIPTLLSHIPEKTNLEINISCPNTEHELVSEKLSKFLHHTREWCIIKLSPTDSITTVDSFYQQGFRQFHCCNTYPTALLTDPTPKYPGGLSGPYLKPHSIQLIQQIKHKYPDTIVIGGGGIRSMQDVHDYQEAGADHIAVSSLCFSPFQFLWLYGNFYYENYLK
mgnify:CR=1 FL=1